MHGRQTLPPVDMNRIHAANQNVPNIKFRDTVVVCVRLFTDMLHLCGARHYSVTARQMFSYLIFQPQSFKTARNVNFKVFFKT